MDSLNHIFCLFLTLPITFISWSFWATGLSVSLASDSSGALSSGCSWDLDSSAAAPSDGFPPAALPPGAFPPVMPPADAFPPVVLPADEFPPDVLPPDAFPPAVLPPDTFPPVVPSPEPLSVCPSPVSAPGLSWLLSSFDSDGSLSVSSPSSASLLSSVMPVSASSDGFVSAAVVSPGPTPAFPGVAVLSGAVSVSGSSAPGFSLPISADTNSLTTVVNLGALS